jgi:hypothetical protein
MTAQKKADPAPARPSTQTATPHLQTSSLAPGARKPWKKKTPVDVVLDQINRLRDDVSRKEEELKLAKQQLHKLDEVLKVLQT